MPTLGVVGSLVWDIIHGRDPAAPPVEEWGGIAYALGGLDAALDPAWTFVPLIKVGSDLRTEAAKLLGTLQRLTPGGRCVEVPVPNNRVTLRYHSAERRAERMSGGVPGWTWSELGPMVRDLDALYLNFISGFEIELGTAQALRQAYQRPIYADLHSLFLAAPPDGVRVWRPLPEPEAWFRCFDIIQINEDELHQLGLEPMTLAAMALAAGVKLLVVTLGARGVVYFAAPGFDGWAPGVAGPSAVTASPIRTALIAAPSVDAIDPTGCGDVFGAALVSRLVAGDRIEPAIVGAQALAARNATLRGANRLGPLLRGELALVEGVA
ncbi:MAG TPA: carbohydrate kinase family protein [Gemmatimonadales bacterium]|nr:carbohydrate kinase family protein [Gemmatimonadales bacterium]